MNLLKSDREVRNPKKIAGVICAEPLGRIIPNHHGTVPIRKPLQAGTWYVRNWNPPRRILILLAVSQRRH